jgi:hypothetical protein
MASQPSQAIWGCSSFACSEISNLPSQIKRSAQREAWSAKRGARSVVREAALGKVQAKIIFC